MIVTFAPRPTVASSHSSSGGIGAVSGRDEYPLVRKSRTKTYPVWVKSRQTLSTINTGPSARRLATRKPASAKSAVSAIAAATRPAWSALIEPSTSSRGW